jgi:hypothetical protein
VNADRIGMMFELFKILKIQKFSIKKMFGESCVTLSSSSVFDNFFEVPQRSGSEEVYKIDFSKTIFEKNKKAKCLQYDAKTLHAIDAEEDTEIRQLFDRGVGLITSATIENHPVSDVIVVVKSSSVAQQYNLILSLSVKGSEFGDDEGAFSFDKKKNLKKMFRDVKAIASFQKLDLKKKKLNIA